MTPRSNARAAPLLRAKLLTDHHMQVIRWSALAFGVFFGFSHQRTITANQKAAHDQHEWEHKQKLIDQAKAEYAKLKNPAPASKGDDGMSSISPSLLKQMVASHRTIRRGPVVKT